MWKYRVTLGEAIDRFTHRPIISTVAANLVIRSLASILASPMA